MEEKLSQYKTHTSIELADVIHVNRTVFTRAVRFSVIHTVPFNDRLEFLSSKTEKTVTSGNGASSKIKAYTLTRHQAYVLALSFNFRKHCAGQDLLDISKYWLTPTAEEIQEYLPKIVNAVREAGGVILHKTSQNAQYL
jgi:hypothetical protein